MNLLKLSYYFWRKWEGDASVEPSTYNDIVQHWINQVLTNRGKDAETSLKFCQDIINYGLRNGDNALVGFGYYYSGETYYLLNDGAHFFEEISKASQTFFTFTEMPDEECFANSAVFNICDGRVAAP